jgi:RNA polymerase sigma-70 factor (ECF subfamily)
MRTRTGVHADLTALVRKHTAEMARYARARVKDPDDADEIVQEAFVAAWTSRERFAEQSSPRTWLFAILKNKLADHYRRTYRQGIKVSGAADSDDQLLEGLCSNQGTWIHPPGSDNALLVSEEEQRNEALDQALMQCLDALPAHWRSAVEMKFLRGLDGRTICAELGISDTNFWQQLHRAKVRLRGCMEGLLNASE